MNNQQPLSHSFDSACYEIRVQGLLSADRYDWLESSILSFNQQQTVLLINLPDQSALYGLLKRIRDCGLPLVSIQRVSLNRCNPEEEYKTTMKAAITERYGNTDTVSIHEIPTPKPSPSEVLIQIKTTTVNSADWRIRSLNVPRGFGLLLRLAFGFSKPRKSVFGLELAGTIVGVGEEVDQFAVGDEVIAFPGSKMGAHAEYIALDENSNILHKPANMDWDAAAALCFGGTTAYDFLMNKGKLNAGERVLINGASGTVGGAAIQIAKYYGAIVTAVCRADNAKLAYQLGADHVIDYRAEDFTTLDQQWDILLDAVGNAPFSRVRHALLPGGRLLMVVADLPQTLKSLFIKDQDNKRAIAGTAREDYGDIQQLITLFTKGAFKPVIQQVIPFQDIRKAHAILDHGHKRGSLVIQVDATERPR